MSNTSSNIFDDLAGLLINKGLSKEDISNILLDIAVQVKMETVEELIERLPEEKTALLYKLIDNSAQDFEITEKLGLDEEEIRKIERKKYLEIVNQISPFLNL